MSWLDNILIVIVLIVIALITITYMSIIYVSIDYFVGDKQYAAVISIVVTYTTFYACEKLNEWNNLRKCYDCGLRKNKDNLHFFSYDEIGHSPYHKPERIIVCKNCYKENVIPVTFDTSKGLLDIDDLDGS